jgi:AcrR family transcriptional regulator
MKVNPRPEPVGGTPHTSSRIEEAALDLFFDQGFKATTMREIALACGLTAGSLYNHFPSKDHLLYTIVKRVHDVLERDLEDAVRSAGEEPRDQLRAYVHRHALLHTGLRKEARVANLEIGSLPEPERTEIVQTRRRLRHNLREIIDRGIAAGVFDAADTSVVANAILNMSIRIPDWFRRDGSLSAEDVAELHADLALRMVGAIP